MNRAIYNRLSYYMSRRIIDFKTGLSTVVPKSLEGRQDLTMMLWAGDCENECVTDVVRLPAYHVYLCNGLSYEGVLKNAADLESYDAPGYICLIDVNDGEQMAKFIKAFKGAFSRIDSDYNGSTPTLSLNDYSDLLRGDGLAYHVEGINGAYYPSYELAYALEIFAPILTPKNNNVRLWTKAIRDLALANNLSCLEVWTSPDLRYLDYDSVRQEQDRYREFLLKINPKAMEACNYKDNLEKYWDLLSVEILTVNIARAYNFWKDDLEQQKDDEGFKDRFAAYLKARCTRELIVNFHSYEDFERINSKTKDAYEQLRGYQKILENLQLAKRISSYPLLHAKICSFVDERRTSLDPEASPVEEYGVVISKV
jgi:hypothetical protein